MATSIIITICINVITSLTAVIVISIITTIIVIIITSTTTTFTASAAAVSCTAAAATVSPSLKLHSAGLAAPPTGIRWNCSSSCEVVGVPVEQQTFNQAFGLVPQTRSQTSFQALR